MGRLLGSGSKPSKAFATEFAQKLANADVSLDQLCKLNPAWPKKLTLLYWYKRHPFFKQLWDQAKLHQADFLAGKILDLHTQVTPKNAHQIRVQFDILRWTTSKLAPNTYGDKPALNGPSTNSVHVQVNLVSPERIADLRHRLNIIRAQSKSLTDSPPPQHSLFDPLKASRQLKLDNGACTGSGTVPDPDLKLDSNPTVEKNGQKKDVHE